MATKFDAEDFKRLSPPRYGQSNPEKITNPLWLEAHARFVTPDRFTEEFTEPPTPRTMLPTDELARRRNQPYSSDREGSEGPLWCFHEYRSGRTDTLLADGRSVLIGGSYEGFPENTDFCIYNEVTVVHEHRKIEIYGFPKTVFPPVQFHSATEYDGDIIIIGGIGYLDQNDTSVCPVFKFDTATFHVEPLQTHGNVPAGLHRHGAVHTANGRIQITGGFITTPERGGADCEFVLNKRFFELDLQTLEWRTLEPEESCWLGLVAEDFWAQTRPRYGTANPERFNAPLWEHIFKQEMGGWGVRMNFGIHNFPAGNNYPGHASYRERSDGPVWASPARRFGTSSVSCEDGRVVHIAGEHEDAYDPDFCIYNDVIVENPNGSIEFYLYPKDVFPPTDFHTATKIGDDVLLIGNVGYQQERKAGETQVLTLNLQDYRVKSIATTGAKPGWIGSHSAEFLAPNAIIIRGGSVMQADGSFTPNTRMFELNVESWTWRRLAPGDTRFFSVAIDDYVRSKAARYGTANPERIDNLFWIEMVRRQWPPSRARQHFDDPGAETEDPQEDQPGRRDTIWTAIREHGAQLELQDGRRLSIGGEVLDYSDERSDAWLYNDIIVRSGDHVEIYAYPLEIFPLLTGLSALERNGQVLIFGRGRYDGEFAHMPMAFVLDPDNFAIRLLDRTFASRPAALTEHPSIEADQIVFPFQKQTSDDPDRYITFSFETLRWRS